MIRGSIPALVTPFKNGKLDLDALKHLVEWQIEQGSTGLVPVGTTGESPTLSHEEHHLVVDTVIRQAAGRVPVIAGAGSNNTAEAIDLMAHAKASGRRCRAGGDALLQQADPGRAGGAFHPPARGGGPADHHLQHPRPLGRRHGAGDDGRARAAAADRGREGCDRQA